MKKLPIKNQIVLLFFFSLELIIGLSPAHAQDTLLHEEWMGAYFQGKKFGFAHSQEWEVKSGNKVSYRLEGESLIKLKIGDDVQETFLKEIAWLDDKLMLQKVYFHQQIETVKKSFWRERTEKISSVELWGERTAKGLALKINSGGEEQKLELAASPGVLTAVCAGFVLFRRGLEPGKLYRLEIFIEPLLLVDKRAEVQVKGMETVKHEGKEVEAYVLEVKFAEHKVTSWVSVKTGETLKKASAEGFGSQFMGGFSSRRESKAEALAFDPAKILELEELFAWSFIPVKKPIKNPQALKTMTLHMTKVPEKDFFLKDERQNWSRVAAAEGGWGAQLHIKVADFADRESLPLLEAKKGKEEYLKSDPFIQSNHPEIVTLGQQIIKGETNAYRAAKKINQWVYKNLGKKYQDSFSALDTLKSREGKCQGHSLLFAALARSQGIPTRMAFGLVYAPAEKGFLYHQWPEVWVGRWVALDPTLGQDQADATHIKLAQGGQEAAVKIVSLVGKIGLEAVARGE